MQINTNYMPNVRQFNNLNDSEEKIKHSSGLNENENNTNAKECFVALSHESEAYTDYINKMDSILNKLGNEEEISKNEKRWLDSEIESFISGHNKFFSSSNFVRQDILKDLIEEKKSEDKRMNELLEQLQKERQAFSPNGTIDIEKELSLKNEAKLIEKFTDAMDNKEDLAKEHLSDITMVKDEFFTENFLETYIDKE